MRLDREERGQVLILALAFLGFGALVIGTLLTFAFASSSATTQLRGQRSTVYTADGATDAAIQLGRVDNTVGAYGDPRCQAADPSSASGPFLVTTTSNDGTTARVVCTWSADLLQPDRTVTLTTFVAGITEPVVRAKVIYHDHYGVAGSGIPVNVLSWTYCGHGNPC
jgi:hypothetical protein